MEIRVQSYKKLIYNEKKFIGALGELGDLGFYCDFEREPALIRAGGWDRDFVGKGLTIGRLLPVLRDNQ